MQHARPVKRVASMVPLVDTNGDFWPHLYENDIEKIKGIVESLQDHKDEDMRDFGLLLQRVLDWITAESRAVVNALKISADRNPDGTITVASYETGITGTGDDVVLALYDCAMNMMNVMENITDMEDEEWDTIDWAESVVNWAKHFPPVIGESTDE